MEAAYSTQVGEGSKPQFRWNRRQTVSFVQQFESQSQSQRQFAERVGLPRSTLQFWKARKDAINLDPCLVDFFESPVGLDLLHGIVVALHLVFELDAGCGLRKICRFLELTGLDRFVASSYGEQQKVAVELQEAVRVFGEQQRRRLASEMSSEIVKPIALAEDETFHPEPCLVAMEPVSGFIFVESYEAKRDAETWTTVVTAGLEGFPVEVIQTVSDEARGLLAHTRTLGAHHSPDVFHVQQEISQATSFPIQSQTRRAEQTVNQMRETAEQLRRQQDACLQQCPESQLANELRQQITQAEQAERDAETAWENCKDQEQQLAEARRGVSNDYHPFDIETGQPRDAEDVSERLNAHFDEIERIAKEVGLSQRCHEKIAKARRVLVLMVATIAFFWKTVEVHLERLSLTTECERLLLQQLIPGYYLLLVARKASGAERRRRLQARGEALLQHARDGPLASLPEDEQERLEQTAQACAALFQRSSSCVEGRNGHLSLWHHSLHRLSTLRLAALTVLHNYFHRRADGTTAAERFFGQRPADLFEWLQDRLPVPARPAPRQRTTAT